MSALGGHSLTSDQCPLYPRKRTLHCTAANVRYVPRADIMQRNKKGAHLVGGNLYRLRVPVKPVSISIDATKTAYFSPASRLEIS